MTDSTEDADLDWQMIDGFRPKADRFLKRFAGCHGRPESREHQSRYIRGQLSDLPRKNCEAIADAEGIPPRSLQDFLAEHAWDHHLATDLLQQMVAEEHHEDHSVGLIDETSFVKRGPHTACTQRQYCGTSGKKDNCVVSVHLGYASFDSRFRCLLDGQLTLPESWADDPARRHKAGIPEDLVHQPKWEIAIKLLERAATNGVRMKWLIFDEGYGCCTAFLEALQARGQLYVAEVPRNFHGWAQEPTVLQKEHRPGKRSAGRPRRFPRLAVKSAKACEVQNLRTHSPKLRDQPWERFHVKDTDKGPMIWRFKAIRFRYRIGRGRPGAGMPSAPAWLIVGESEHTGEVKYFVSNAPAGMPLETLMHVAFSRWKVERLFQDDKSKLGMHHFECRKWVAIHRHLVLTSMSHLLLAKLDQEVGSGGKKVPVAEPVAACGAGIAGGSWREATAA